MIIIGITGTLGAGKGTIVEYLTQQKGFDHYSVRDFLIAEIKNRGLEVNRDTMTSTANELRANNSPSYITDALFSIACKKGQSAVIESIRTPGEIESLKEKGKFVLFAVDADKQTRYKRITARKSETDNISFETFIANEEREMNSNDPNKQNLRKCIKMADYIFNNDSTIKELNTKVEETLSLIM
ncbi:MAG: AAA family ATPase [Bacteroidota bacterium]|nr:AAA family ATPase [Bacteroidota bacterium]